MDISYWKWAERPDTIPTGLLEVARADLSLVYDTLEAELTEREYISGPLSIADIALFPHIASARAGPGIAGTPEAEDPELNHGPAGPRPDPRPNRFRRAACGPSTWHAQQGGQLSA